MAVSGVQSNKQMKRLESRKSHSWWWDSHISPKNSKWLSENLEEMDRNVKRMLKLVEEDANSFARRTEMYYKRRPELIALVEEFYRGYRSLAERYDHVTGELRKNLPSDLQSQGSGISDTGSEPSFSWLSPMPGRRKSSNRAAGFDFFLGSGGNGSDVNQKDGDESSTMTDSEEESDDSSVNNYSGFSRNGGDAGMNRRITELETELREVKEKLWMQDEERAEVSSRGTRSENAEDIFAKINAYEQELMIVNEKLRLSEEEITKLKALETQIASMKTEANDSSERIQQLQDQLDSARKDIATWKTKFNSEKRETNKLQERLARFPRFSTWHNGPWCNSKHQFETSLLDRDHEIRDLKTAVSDAEQKIFPEKAQLKSEMSKLLEEQTPLKEQIREWECRGWSLEEEIRNIQSEKMETEAALKGEIELLRADTELRENNIKDLNVSLDTLKLERDNLNVQVGSLKEKVKSRDGRIEHLDIYLNQLHLEHVQLIAGMEEAHRQVEELKTKAKELEEEVERQKVEILQRAEEKREAIKDLNVSHDTLKLERDNLNVQVGSLKEEVKSRDGRIEHLDIHLNQLHLEHVQLIAGMEEAHRQVEELKTKAKQLEEEVERQKAEILEGAEEKREAIRQLCFSLEHYKNNYHMLRQHFIGHKRVPVLAT